MLNSCLDALAIVDDDAGVRPIASTLAVLGDIDMQRLSAVDALSITTESSPVWGLRGKPMVLMR